jgi:hypothetical protein
MTDKRQLIPIAGLIATIAMAMYMVARLDGQAPELTANSSTAAVAAVHGMESITNSPDQP